MVLKKCPNILISFEVFFIEKRFVSEICFYQSVKQTCFIQIPEIIHIQYLLVYSDTLGQGLENMLG